MNSMCLYQNIKETKNLKSETFKFKSPATLNY